MKSIFDDVSEECARKTTTMYSTSFSSAVKMLSYDIRPAIHNIYGFVRFADEIVDTFHDWDKEYLLNKFERDFFEAYEIGISLNPILNAFQKTVKEYNIDMELIEAFLKSMRMDLDKKNYLSSEDYKEYIYGSADVVGLMCLKVFVKGDDEQYEKLKYSAMKLGSAFQKVNFLRDIKADMELLGRSYFPNIDFNALDVEAKNNIIEDIEHDFNEAYKGIILLPESAKLGVYTAYIYYRTLLKKLQKTPHTDIMQNRIRVNNYGKLRLLCQSFVQIKLNTL